MKSLQNESQVAATFRMKYTQQTAPIVLSTKIKLDILFSSNETGIAWNKVSFVSIAK